MLQVGLTGNIASGKSHASGVFAELGAKVIDADAIVHDLFSPGTETYKKVAAAFGPRVIGSDGTIDRRALGEIVFHDRSKLQLLNVLVHPDVQREVMARVFELEKRGFDGIVITDAALLVESGYYRRQDRLIVVTCDPDLQLARVMTRCGLSEEEAQVRIDSQMRQEEKVRLADYTIDTSGTYSRTREQIEGIYRDLLQNLRQRRPA